ncbi:MAG: retroviral-like aspartic protease family protein [Bacteroidota bacterium]
MSSFKVSVVCVNTQDKNKTTPALEALVDTGSELTWMPSELLVTAGITPVKKAVFITATGEKVERNIGYAIIRAEGFETNDEVVFAKQGDAVLLGVRTLEGFSVTVDNISHRLIARASLVASFHRI